MGYQSEYYDNEDAGDLEIANRAGYFESVAEDHENHDKEFPTKDCWICEQEHES